MPKTNKVVIVVPTYNENDNIHDLVHTLFNEIFPNIPDHFDMHLLVVDDSSPDGTGTTVKKLQKEFSKLHLLTNPNKSGLGGAYTKGMLHALEKLDADIVFEFDADFSHDPNKIQPMLEMIEDGKDVVLGSRYMAGGSIPDNWGLHRKFLSVVGNLFIRFIMTDFSVHDWTTGYRAIKRSVVEVVLKELNEEKFMGYTFQIGFLHKAIRSGFNIGEVPFHFIDREKGKSKLGSEYIKNTLRYILKVRAKEILSSRITKFVVVGGIGAVVQLGSLTIIRRFLPYQWSYFVSVEAAVISNFILSNLWTFADRKLTLAQVPFKFIQFNLASSGSIIIQQILAFIGETYIGFINLFTLPIIHVPVDTGLVFAVTGILLGMFWNFFAYSKIIWHKK